MLQPKKPLDLSSAKQILEGDKSLSNEDRKPLDLSSAQAILKKKDGTKPVSTSTTPTENTASVQKVGSSDSQFELKPVKDERGKEVYERVNGQLVPKMEKVKKGFASSTEYEVAKQQDLKKKASSYSPTEDYNQFSQVYNLTDQEKQIADEQAVVDATTGGFWGGIKQGTAGAVNRVTNALGVGNAIEIKKPLQDEKKEAQKILLEKYKNDASKITDKEVTEVAFNILKTKKEDDLRTAKVNDYLSSLPEEKVKALNLERVKASESLNAKDKFLNTAIAIEATKAEQLAKDLVISKKIIDASTKSGKKLPEGFLERTQKNFIDYNKKINELSNLEKQYVDNVKETSTIEDELDFLKRNYSTSEKLKATAIEGGLSGLAKQGAGLMLWAEDIAPEFLQSFSEEDRDFYNKVIERADEVQQAKSELFKRDISFDNLSTDTFGEFFWQEVGTQIPIYAQMYFSTPSIFATGMGDKYSDMVGGMSKKDLPYSYAQTVFAPVAYGGLEYALGSVPTKGIMDRAVRSIESIGKKEILKTGLKQYVAKNATELGVDMATEGVTEGLTTLGQNIVDIYALDKKDVNLFDNVGHSAFTGLMLSGAMRAVPMAFGTVVKSFTPAIKQEEVKTNLEQIAALQLQLENETITENSKKLIKNKITQLISANNQVLKDTEKFIAKNLTEEGYNKIVEIDKRETELKSQAEEIKLDQSLNDDVKKALLNDLGQEFKKNQEQREKILSNESTVLDALPDSEQIKLKDKAQRELRKELEVKGETKIELNDDQITKRAVKIYEESKTPTVEQKSETQSQAEKQAEVVEVEPIRQLGNGANVYFETEKHRVNDFGKDKILLNIGEKDSALPAKSIEFETAEEAVYVAKEVEKAYPNGVPSALLIDKYVEQLKDNYKDEATPSNTTPVNEGVQPRTNQVGEMAVEQQPASEVAKSEDLQSANDVRAVEVEVESKKLTPEQQKSNRLLDLKSEFNSLNNRDKKGKRGTELRLRIATIAGELNYKVDEKLGKISITRKSDGKNVGKVSFKEEIKESEQSDIDFVKGQIEYGALAWDNNPMSPRINLGISRADITKGIADIQAGKVNSVPAKRLVQAMVEQRKKGVYEFIQGSGQNVERLEVPIVEDLNTQEQEVADFLENYHTDEEIAQYFTELEQLNNQENENTKSVTEKIDDTSDSETIIEKPAVEEKNNVKEKITESELPTKKGEKSVIVIGENVEAVITIGKDLSGEPTLIVSVLKDGEVQEDKFGDTEVEFSMDEKAEVLKFIEDKKRGYSLAGKGKKGKDVDVKEDIESGKNVTFELFGETKNGVLQSDNSIVGIDGTRYTPSMVKNVRSRKNNDDIQDDEVVAGQGLFSYSPNQRDISLSKEGIVYDKAEYFKKFKRFWNQTFRTNAGAPKIIANIIRSLGYERSAFTTVLEHEVESLNSIERSLRTMFPKESEFIEKNVLISEYIAGKNVDLSFLTNEQIADLDYMRARIDGLSDKLIDKLEEKMETLDSRLEEAEEGTSKYDSLIEAKERLQSLIDTIKNNKGQYIHRSYQAFSDPKYLDALMSENVNKAGRIRLNNAIEFVMAENEVSEAEATRQIYTYLDGLRGKKDFISAITNGKARADFLKKRKDIPQPIRELLGESKEPAFNYVNTVFKISDYLASLEYQERMSRALLNMPSMASLDAKEGFTELASKSEGWTTLSGIYVKEDLANAIDDLQPLETVNSGFYSGWIKFVAFTKLGKTVLAPTTTARNLISGTFLAWNAGFNPFVSKKQVLKSIQVAFGTEKSMTEMKAETVKLIKLGIVNDGAVSGEILATLNDFSKSMERMLKKSPLEKGLSPQERATALLEKGLLVAQTLYKFGDDFYKIIGFYQYKQRYMKSGMTESEAETKAAERITDTFPTYSKIPKTIQRLRRLPIIGSFPSFSYEVYRTTYNGLKYINEDRKEGRNEMMAQQIAGMLMANASLYALSYFSMAMLGIDDEDDDFIRDGLPEWQRNAQLIYTDNDERRPTFIDGTALFPGEVIMKPLRTLLEQRESRTSPAKTRQSIQEFSGPFTDLDINSKTMIDLLINKKDNGKPIYEGENLVEGIFKDPNKVADYFMKQAGPGVYNNMTEFARANEVAPEYFGDKTTPYGREYTNQDALLALFGFRFSTINYQSLLKNVGFEMKFKYDLYRTDLNKKIKSTALMDKEKINGLAEEYAEKNEDIFKSLVNGVQTARKLGMSDPEISKSLELGNYSKIDIKNLLRGNTPHLKEITDASLKSQFKEIEINYTDEQKANTLKDNLSKNVKIYNDLIKKKNNEDKKILESQGFSRPSRPQIPRP